MNVKEAEALVKKAMSVILSCNTMTQLDISVRYADLAYWKLSREVGLVNNSRFICLIERSIGFAQCKIKSNDMETEQ